MGLGIARCSARFIAKSSNGRMGLSESSRVGSTPAFATFAKWKNFFSHFWAYPTCNEEQSSP